MKLFVAASLECTEGSSILRKAIAIACAILLSFALLHFLAGAKTYAWPISVKVVDLNNTPIKNAYIALWNHTATPSAMVTQTKSDGQGLATLVYRGLQDVYPDYVHLSVMVTAAGYETSSWHWSLDSQEAATSVLTPEQITVTLKHSERPGEVIDNFRAGGFVQPTDYPR